MPREKEDLNKRDWEEGEDSIDFLDESLKELVRNAKDHKDNYREAELVWQDNAFRFYEDCYFRPIAQKTTDYIIAAEEHLRTLKIVEEQVQKLLSPVAGLGNWLSFSDIEMIAKRGASRLFDGDGWG